MPESKDVSVIGKVYIFNTGTGEADLSLNNTTIGAAKAVTKDDDYVQKNPVIIERTSAGDPGRIAKFGTKNSLSVDYGIVTDSYTITIDPSDFTAEEDLQIYLFRGKALLVSKGKVIDGVIKNG